MNYVEAVAHPEVFAPWFAGPTWAAWGVVERAIFGLPIAEADLPLFRELTGRDEAPSMQASEAWIVAGRRSGKSRKAATIATFAATIGAEVAGWRRTLAPGERGVVLVLAVDKSQAKVTLGYAKAYFREVPMFRELVERETNEGLELANGMSLTVAASDYRSIRGRTVVAGIFDEVAYWRSETSTNPDVEVYRAVKPAMATVPGALLVAISSPHRRAGLLWQKFRRHWGRPGPVLVVRAPTSALNSVIDQGVVDQAYEDDPEAARAEWGAEFRTDLADYVSREVVERLVSPGVFERPRAPGVNYVAFTDPSGGARDSFTLAIGHSENEIAVLDVLRERRAPFDPEGVTAEFADVLRGYGCTRVRGDKYAGRWPMEQFAKRGLHYEASELGKSEIYLEALPLLNAGRVDLLDHQRLVAQICGLERRSVRGGRDRVDHGVHASDDVANAALGALLQSVKRRRFQLVW